MSYFPEIKKFLEQTRTPNLKTSSYLKVFKGLSVKVSFGQGNKAKIPWIAFLNETDSVQEGIYPVFLYYKEKELLILAHGISETRKPSRSWNLKDKVTIKEHFEENNIGTPKRYGSSYVFRTYSTKKPLNKEEIDKDLIHMISIYKETEPSPINRQTTHVNSEKTARFDAKKFEKNLSIAGLFFSPKTITRFISSLVTKPFVILTGLSGSGKTKLAQAFAQWICQDKNQYCIVPVGADWTNREPLLGYPNALKPNEYIKPDNGTLDLIIQANNNPNLPHFLILDEMNLSHVERYFADFLSVMESKETISLFTEGTANNGVPAKLALPSNLFVIGTVNIDETTYMFSPKVLDRANTIEFRVTKEEIEYFFNNQKEVDTVKLKAHGATMAQSFLSLAKKTKFEEQDLSKIHITLANFFEQLKKTGAEFGYRSANEIIRLINQLTVINSNLSHNEKLDIAIMQKLLPKLHGSRRKLCPVLITLGSFCIDKDKIGNIEKEVFAKEDFDFESNAVIYPISLEKITRMYRGAIDNGFASYAEA